MDATIMPSITSLVSKLQADFPDLTFIPGEEFQWNPHDRTISYQPRSDDRASLLHEVSHALLGHAAYAKDIILIEMERDAWEQVVHSLAEKYQVAVDQNAVQDALDTYRDWLHARSTCPHCKATGMQTQKSHYKCLACETEWRVNDARVCALRRYTL